MVDIKRFDIASTVTDSLIDVFDMMLSMQLQLSDDDSKNIDNDERIVGSVSMAGRVLGCINIEVSKKFANMMTNAMLGAAPEEVPEEDEIKDVIREMCNIVGGNLKSAFCDTGLVCELSPPSFTTGDDFKIESLNTVRHERYVFQCEENIVIVEVGIRVGEAVEEGDDSALKNATQLRPIDINTVKEFDVKSPVVDQTIDLFNVMLSMELKHSEEGAEYDFPPDRLVGAVSFVGSLMGNFSIHVSKELSRQMTAAMLGIELDEVEGEEDVKDVISELCNIIGGNLKSKFCDSGMVCELSTPTLTTGKSFKIEAKDMVRYDTFSFEYENELIVVQVALKVADETQMESPEEDIPEETNISQEDIDALLAHEGVAQSLSEKLSKDAIAEGSDEGSVDLDEMGDEERIDFILDIPLEIVVELGRNRMKVCDLYKTGPGSIVEFANLAGEPLDIMVNGTLIAKGEVMVQGEKYGIRIVDILSRSERIRSMF